ncbi:hypothetical protein D5073_05535 [Pectobacterium versatile]|nr:hypothetical protein EIP93_02480 [Pectobacterium versatile]MCL6396523.1 hypothetical protein [Pectobacterium carotovorum subsp. carotovorum]MBA0172591.1 hypothetical protein [Pectobacterium versatile]MBQ4762739.1 hypothetical protein [Pectobacterium versatile]RJL57275.1 hypothetical protein D5073_05535 [Pectobacterium versatile]
MTVQFTIYPERHLFESCGNEKRGMTMSAFFNEIDRLSPRELQRYASACLQAYCNAKLIQHPSIGALIAHLNHYPESGSLAEWERKGALLPLNGRGDDIPQDLILSISPQDIETFSYLVDVVVEVGIVDMYGAPTTLPAEFVTKIALILSKNNIDLPEC